MRLTYLKNGETLFLDQAVCRGCRQCIEVCPHAVFQMVDGRSSIADREACMECGACMKNCASGAVRVTAGVGCAAAIIGGMIRGTAASCGPDCCAAVPGSAAATPDRSTGRVPLGIMKEGGCHEDNRGDRRRRV